VIYDQNQLSRVKWGHMSLEGGREELSDGECQSSQMNQQLYEDVYCGRDLYLLTGWMGGGIGKFISPF
jgi:hypothetical protein